MLELFFKLNNKNYMLVILIYGKLCIKIWEIKRIDANKKWPWKLRNDYKIIIMLGNCFNPVAISQDDFILQDNY